MNQNLVDQIVVPHTAFVSALNALEQYFRWIPTSSESIGIPLIGDTRTGKSRLLKLMEAKHPRVRVEEGLTIPVLRVKVPPVPSIKNLAEAILIEMGEPVQPQMTLARKTHQLIRLLNGSGTRLMFLDDFQQFHDKRTSRLWYTVGDWMKNVMDESKVAFVPSGLRAVMTVIGENEQLEARCVAPIEMPTFNWKVEHDRAEFIGILDSFERGLKTRFDILRLGNDSIGIQFYLATGGRIGLVAKILRAAVWNCSQDNMATIGLDELRRAFAQSMVKNGLVGDADRLFTKRFSEKLDIRPSNDTTTQTSSKIGRRAQRKQSVSEVLRAN